MRPAVNGCWLSDFSFSNRKNNMIEYDCFIFFFFVLFTNFRMLNVWVNFSNVKCICEFFECLIYSFFWKPFWKDRWLKNKCQTKIYRNAWENLRMINWMVVPWTFPSKALPFPMYSQLQENWTVSWNSKNRKNPTSSASKNKKGNSLPCMEIW